MLEKDYKAWVLAALQDLDQEHRIAFGASCCERALPDYQFASALEGFGNPTLLRGILDEIWKGLHGSGFSPAEFRQFLSACENNIPDSDEFGSIIAEIGQDSAIVLAHTLECCLEDNPECALTVANAVIEGLETYLTWVNDPHVTLTDGSHSDLEGWPAETSLALSTVEWRKLCTAASREQWLHFSEWIWNSPMMRAELDKQRMDLDLLKAHPSLDSDLLITLRRTSSLNGLRLKERLCSGGIFKLGAID